MKQKQPKLGYFILLSILYIYLTYSVFIFIPLYTVHSTVFISYLIPYSVNVTSYSWIFIPLSILYILYCIYRMNIIIHMHYIYLYHICTTYCYCCSCSVFYCIYIYIYIYIYISFNIHHHCSMVNTVHTAHILLLYSQTAFRCLSTCTLCNDNKVESNLIWTQHDKMDCN